MKCRYDRDSGDYLADGKPCKVDEYGDPTHHCTARRSCSNHIGRDELTCNGCITSARTALRRIADLLAIADPEHIDDDAFDQRAPTAHPVRHWWRLIDARRTIDADQQVSDQHKATAHAALADDDGDDHAGSLLVTWEAMLREDYGHDTEHITAATALDYLDRQMVKVAQDPAQDFPLLLRELRSAVSRLEVAVRDSTRPERGVPCPDCVADEVGTPRLVRHYGHWCEDDDCHLEHYRDDKGDTWECPRNPAHTWEHKAYENYLADRTA